MQIDILLLHKEQGELPEEARRILAGLVERLGEYTLLEFKSPSDTLRPGDFQTFLAYALLYRAQNQPLLEPNRLHQVVLAPRLTSPYRNEMQVLSVTTQEEEPGIWRLQGGLVVHPTWVLETETLVGLEHPLLTLFSPTFLNRSTDISDLLQRNGYTVLVGYLSQQIHQFDLLGMEFAMQHLGAEDELKQVLKGILATMSLQERLEGLSPQERMEGLSPQEWLEGLSEERLRGLPPEQLERLRQLLQQVPPTRGDPSSPKGP